MIKLPLPNQDLYLYDDELWGGTVVASQWFYESDEPAGAGSQALVLLLAKEPPYYRLMVVTYVVNEDIEEPPGNPVYFGVFTGWLRNGEDVQTYRNIIDAVKAYEEY